MDSVGYDYGKKDGAHQLQEFSVFAESLGASEVMLDAYDCTNIGRGRRAMALSPENYAAVPEEQKHIRGKAVFTVRNSGKLWHSEDDIPVCDAWRSDLSILPSSVYPFCETLADDPFFVLGTFPKDSVMDAWRSPRIDEIHHPEKAKCDKVCAECRLFSRCRTGCFKNKVTAGLSYYSRDPNCRIV